MLATLANMLPLSLEEDFPTLENFKNKIFELPNIKKWIETRPVTENWNQGQLQLSLIETYQNAAMKYNFEKKSSV